MTQLLKGASMRSLAQRCWTPTCIADRPSVISPIFGARNMQQLTDTLRAADLHLDGDATAALDAVSAPTPGGYPYGAFGAGQRSRSLDGRSAQQELIPGGSDAPLGRR